MTHRPTTDRPARAGRTTGAAVVALALVLGAAGCSDDESGPAPAPAPTAASTAPTEQPATAVRVLDPGAEPRREVRHRLRAGTEALVTSTSDLEIDQAVGSLRQRLDAPPIRQTLAHRVVAVDEGIATIEAEVVALEVRDEGTGLTEGEVRELDAQLAPLVGMRTTTQTSDRGEVVATDVAVPVGAGDGQQRQADDLATQVIGMGPVLPLEPIGDGARWEVTSEVDLAGTPATVLRTYTATEITDDALTWELELRIDAQPDAEPEPDPDGVPEADATATVLRSATLEGRASGTTTWDVAVASMEATIEGEQVVAPAPSPGEPAGDGEGGEGEGDGEDVVLQEVRLAFRSEVVAGSAG